VVYVFDIEHYNRQIIMAGVKHIVDAIYELPPSNPFGIVYVRTKVQRLAGNLVTPTEEHKERVLKFLNEETTPQGDSRPAINEAIRLKPARIAYVGRGQGHTWHLYVRDRCKRAGIKVDTWGRYAADQEETIALEALSEATGGKFEPRED
jgi:hypothetical protein